MTQTDVQWSSSEKKIAKDALKKAYDREVDSLLKYVKGHLNKLMHLEDVWQLHDLLSARRHDIDGKYDDREAFLMFTLSKLIKDGLLKKEELAGLTADKRAKVNLLSRM